MRQLFQKRASKEDRTGEERGSLKIPRKAWFSSSSFISGPPTKSQLVKLLKIYVTYRPHHNPKVKEQSPEAQKAHKAMKTECSSTRKKKCPLQSLQVQHASRDKALSCHSSYL